jgi:hypothetical protein
MGFLSNHRGGSGIDGWYPCQNNRIHLSGRRDYYKFRGWLQSETVMGGA